MSRTEHPRGKGRIRQTDWLRDPKGAGWLPGSRWWQRYSHKFDRRQGREAARPDEPQTASADSETDARS